MIEWRKWIYLFGSFFIVIPVFGVGIVIMLAAYADYRGWDSKDVGG